MIRTYTDDSVINKGNTKNTKYIIHIIISYIIPHLNCPTHHAADAAAGQPATIFSLIASGFPSKSSLAISNAFSWHASQHKSRCKHTHTHTKRGVSYTCVKDIHQKKALILKSEILLKCSKCLKKPTTFAKQTITPLKLLVQTSNHIRTMTAGWTQGDGLLLHFLWYFIRRHKLDIRKSCHLFKALRSATKQNDQNETWQYKYLVCSSKPK